MSSSLKRLIVLSLLTAMALVIFVVEAQIPLPIPIPGIKLGLANVVTLIILAKYRVRDAAIVLFLRILLGSLFTGILTTFVYSLCGGFLSLLVMAILSRCFHRKCLWFVGIAGAIFHGVGQIVAAAAMMTTWTVVVYLPFLALAGIFTGLFTGICANAVVKHLPSLVALPNKKQSRSHQKTKKK